MLNLMIVDDEELIREEIKSKITRISHPAIGSIMLAADGIEAKQALREFKPEIVISDIRMPGIDGLSLIRECSQTNPEVKFIVLSGYGDYGYVREAFKYGIIDYLLKPVRLSELETQLNKAIIQYKTEAPRESQVASISSTTDEIRQCLIDIVNGDAPDHPPSSRLSNDHPESCWRICRFLYDRHDFGDTPSVENIQEMMNNLLNEYGENMLISSVTLKTGQDGGTIAINHSDSINPKKMKIMLQTLIDHLSRVSRTRVMAALSEALTLSSLMEADRKAENILSYRILHEGSFVLDDVDGKGKEKRLPLDNIEIESLMENIRMLKLEEARQSINEWFQPTRLRTIDTASIRQMYLMILTEIYRWHNDKLPEEMICRQDDFNHHHSLHDIRQHLFKQLNSIDRGVRQTGVRSNSAIGIVKQYIEAHPYGDVTLAEVSNLVSMNYTYFSSWFKTEMGLTFSAFVMRQRMEKAKRLLEDPTTRINEVAVRVGYDNMYHFSRAFKNYSGMSPKEYRKKSYDM